MEKVGNKECWVLLTPLDLKFLSNKQDEIQNWFLSITFFFFSGLQASK